MAKDAYYFQHDSNAHNDPKMLALRIKTGWEGIGLYWTLLEILRDMPEYKYAMTNGYLTELELRLSHPKATLEAWLNEACVIGLFVKKDGFLYSESFLRRMQEIDERRAILSEAGRRGGLSSRQAQGRLKPPLSSKVKESKVKESKVKESNNRFIPPTIEEVETYCLDRKNSVDPQKWHSWYTANGWKVGKNPMKDWRAAVRTWERKEIAEAGSNLTKAQRSNLAGLKRTMERIKNDGRGISEGLPDIGGGLPRLTIQ